MQDYILYASVNCVAPIIYLYQGTRIRGALGAHFSG